MTESASFHKPLLPRCMGGARCDHAPGTCTATKATAPPDWVLIEAAKRRGWGYHVDFMRDLYRDNSCTRALCDMIHKHEQPPVDRKLLCAREAGAMQDANKAYQYVNGARDDYGDVKACIRAIELWESGYGK